MRRRGIELTKNDRKRLEAVANDPAGRSRSKARARIVLMAGEGASDQEIHLALEKNRTTIRRSLERFRAEGCEGLLRERSRRPGKHPISNVVRQNLVQRTMTERPSNGLFWTEREMAHLTGLGRSTIRNIWQQHHIAPHHIRQWRKLDDLVGLYSDTFMFALAFTRQVSPKDRPTECRASRVGQQSDDELRRYLHGMVREIGQTIHHTHFRVGASYRVAMYRGCLKYCQAFIDEVERLTRPDIGLHVLFGCRHGDEVMRQGELSGQRFEWTMSFAPNLEWLMQALIYVFDRALPTIARGEAFRSIGELRSAVLCSPSMRIDSPFSWCRGQKA